MSETTLSEMDTPTDRGSDWQERAAEVKERDGHECLRCGREDDGFGHHTLETHHIIRGKNLPKSIARLDLNLVTVCTSCHGTLEKKTPKQQFRETGRWVAVDILSLLERGRLKPKRLKELSSASRDRVTKVAGHLYDLGLIEVVNTQYCLASSVNAVRATNSGGGGDATDYGAEIEQAKSCITAAAQVINDSMYKAELAARQGNTTELVEELHRVDDATDELEKAMEVLEDAD